LICPVQVAQGSKKCCFGLFSYPIAYNKYAVEIARNSVKTGLSFVAFSLLLDSDRSQSAQRDRKMRIPRLFCFAQLCQLYRLSLGILRAVCGICP
jgi:hypothetical protein